MIILGGRVIVLKGGKYSDQSSLLLTLLLMRSETVSYIN